MVIYGLAGGGPENVDGGMLSEFCFVLHFFLKISLAFEENELSLGPADKLTTYFEISEGYILNLLFYCVLSLLICL